MSEQEFKIKREIKFRENIVAEVPFLQDIREDETCDVDNVASGNNPSAELADVKNVVLFKRRIYLNENIVGEVPVISPKRVLQTLTIPENNNDINEEPDVKSPEIEFDEIYEFISKTPTEIDNNITEIVNNEDENIDPAVVEVKFEEILQSYEDKQRPISQDTQISTKQSKIPIFRQLSETGKRFLSRAPRRRSLDIKEFENNVQSKIKRFESVERVDDCDSESKDGLIHYEYVKVVNDADDRPNAKGNKVESILLKDPLEFTEKSSDRRPVLAKFLNIPKVNKDQTISSEDNTSETKKITDVKKKGKSGIPLLKKSSVTENINYNNDIEIKPTTIPADHTTHLETNVYGDVLIKEEENSFTPETKVVKGVTNNKDNRVNTKPIIVQEQIKISYPDASEVTDDVYNENIKSSQETKYDKPQIEYQKKVKKEKIKEEVGFKSVSSKIALFENRKKEAPKFEKIFRTKSHEDPIKKIADQNVPAHISNKLYYDQQYGGKDDVEYNTEIINIADERTEKYVDEPTSQDRDVHSDTLIIADDTKNIYESHNVNVEYDDIRQELNSNAEQVVTSGPACPVPQDLKDPKGTNEMRVSDPKKEDNKSDKDMIKLVATPNPVQKEMKEPKENSVNILSEPRKDIIKSDKNINRVNNDIIKADNDIIRSDKTIIEVKTDKIKEDNDIKSYQGIHKLEKEIIKSNDINKSTKDVGKVGKDTIKSDRNIYKAESDITKSDKKIIKTDKDKNKSATNTIKIDNDMIKSDRSIMKEDIDLIKEDKNITSSDKDIIIKSDKNIIKVHNEKSDRDIIKVDKDIIKADNDIKSDKSINKSKKVINKPENLSKSDQEILKLDKDPKETNEKRLSQPQKDINKSDKDIYKSDIYTYRLDKDIITLVATPGSMQQELKESKETNKKVSSEPNKDIIKLEKNIIRVENDIITSDSDIIKSDKTILKANKDQVKSYNSIIKSDQNRVKVDNGMIKSDRNIIKADVDIIKSDHDIIKSDHEIITADGDKGSNKSDKDIIKTDKNIIKSDKNIIKRPLTILTPKPREELPTLKRAKSLADIELGPKIKGKVGLAIKELFVDKVFDKPSGIAMKERPRRNSVSEKIALFEKKITPVQMDDELLTIQDKLKMADAMPPVIGLDNYPIPGIPLRGKTPPKLETEADRKQYLIDRLMNVKEELMPYEKYDNMPFYQMRDGNKMPVIALGSALLLSDLTKYVVAAAIDLGYRAIDTAYIYGNEKQVGEGIQMKIDDGTIKRSDIFVTSKLWNTYHAPQLVETACRESLRTLGLEYVDLYLIHQPMSFKEGPDPTPMVNNKLQYSEDHDYVDAWKALIELKRQKLVRSIGVSNFNVEQLQTLINETGETPAVNQIECHPYLTQRALSDFCAANHIAVSAYGALGSKGTPAEYKSSNATAVLDDVTIRHLAKRSGLSPTQILLRYQLERGHCIVVKSATPEHLLMNLSCLNMKLTKQQVALLDQLNRDQRNFDFRGMGDTHKNYPFSAFE